MDRAAFLADDFDVKAWINQACGDRQSRDELSRWRVLAGEAASRPTCCLPARSCCVLRHRA